MTNRGREGGFQNWGQLRAHAIHLYNETPHPATEQDIINAYTLHPQQIEEAVLSVAADVATGTARSGWAVLRTRATRITTPPANPTRNTSLEREKRITRAEQWIRATGCHFDRQTELEDELFGDRGLLQDYTQDQHLQARMTALWQERRPISEALEREAHQAAERWKRQQEDHPWNAQPQHSSPEHSSVPASAPRTTTSPSCSPSTSSGSSYSCSKT